MGRSHNYPRTTPGLYFTGEEGVECGVASKMEDFSQGLDGGSELSWFFTFGSKMVIPGPEGRYARPKGMGV